MSSTCFEHEGSPSGRRLYVQEWYSVFYMHQYKQSCRWKTAYTDVCKTYYNKAVYIIVSIYQFTSYISCIFSHHTVFTSSITFSFFAEPPPTAAGCFGVMK
jgi:hypothetical protein